METLLIVVGLAVVLGIFALGIFLKFVEAHIGAALISGNRQQAVKWTTIERNGRNGVSHRFSSMDLYIYCARD